MTSRHHYVSLLDLMLGFTGVMLVLLSVTSAGVGKEEIPDRWEYVYLEVELAAPGGDAGVVQVASSIMDVAAGGAHVVVGAPRREAGAIYYDFFASTNPRPDSADSDLVGEPEPGSGQAGRRDLLTVKFLSDRLGGLRVVQCLLYGERDTRGRRVPFGDAGGGGLGVEAKPMFVEALREVETAANDVVDGPSAAFEFELSLDDG